MTASAYVPGQILTADALNTSFDEKTDNAAAAITGGSIDGIDHITVTGVVDAVSPTSGAVIVTGGVGIGMALNIGSTLTAAGVVRFLSTQTTSSPATGALVVSGGVGIGGNIQVNGAATIKVGVSTGTFQGTDTTNATSAATGAMTLAGGLGVAKDVWVGGSINVLGSIAVQGNTVLQGDLSADSLTLSSGGFVKFGDLSTQTTAWIDAAADGKKYGRNNHNWVALTDIPEAPSDGKKYGRSNAAWVVLTDTDDAPNDAFYYGRHAAAWAKVTAEAPLDAFIYGRANGAWVKSVTEAPIDGKQYTRYNGAWTQVSASGMVVSDTPPTDVARFPQWWDTRSGTLFIWYDDGTSAQWVICVPVPETSGGGGGGGGVAWGAITGLMSDQADLTAALALKLSDAPSNATTYGRQGGAWVAVSGGGGGIPDAPSDGTLYGRKNAAWVAAPAAGIPDAPSDGTLYGRKNAAWVAAPAAGLPADGSGAMTGILSLGAIGQVKFPAVVNYSADPNTLDDYEEGTWTPTIPIAGLVVNFATYTKVGRLVHVNAFVQFPTVSDPGSVIFGGLPFRSIVQNAFSIGYQNSAIALQQTLMAAGNGINLYAGGGFATYTQVSGTQLYFSGVYMTAPPESAVISFMNNTGATTWAGPGSVSPDTFWSNRAGTNVTISNVQGNPAAATAMNGQTVPVTITNAGTRFNLGITTTGIDMTGVTATLTSPP